MPCPSTVDCAGRAFGPRFRLFRFVRELYIHREMGYIVPELQVQLARNLFIIVLQKPHEGAGYPSLTRSPTQTAVRDIYLPPSLS